MTSLYKARLGNRPSMADPYALAAIIDLIYYQYAKIIAHSALHAPDGTAAKAHHYGFIKQTFRELQNKLFAKG